MINSNSSLSPLPRGQSGWGKDKKFQTFNNKVRSPGNQLPSRGYTGALQPPLISLTYEEEKNKKKPLATSEIPRILAAVGQEKGAETKYIFLIMLQFVCFAENLWCWVKLIHIKLFSKI